VARIKQKSPRHIQRERVSSSVEARGETAKNIWLVRPPFSTRDLVLSSDFQRQSFYWIEGEPSFVKIDYADPWWAGTSARTARSARGAPRHFASAFTREGARCEIYLDAENGSSAPPGSAANAGRVHISDYTLKAHAQRVDNWPRILACIRRLMVGTSPVIERRILWAVVSPRPLTMRELAYQLSDIPPAVLRGTVCALLRKRELASDLDTAPWSMSTKLGQGTDT
jgi:hypothetical protein